MQKPERPYGPHKWDYEKDFNEEVLFDKHLITNEDDDWEAYLDNWKDQQEWKEGDRLPVLDTWGHSNHICSLADLIAMAPKDALPENVHVILDSDRYITSVIVQVVAKIPTDKKALRAAYKKAEAEFQAKEVAYNKELKLFEEWEKQQEIRALEEKLSQLKK